MKGTANVSLTKRHFEEQPDWYAEPVGSGLEETLSDVSHVSRALHAVKNPGDLDAESLCELCVYLFNAERRLTGMLEAERGAR